MEARVMGVLAAFWLTVALLATLAGVRDHHENASNGSVNVLLSVSVLVKFRPCVFQNCDFFSRRHRAQTGAFNEISRQNEQTFCIFGLTTTTFKALQKRIEGCPETVGNLLLSLQTDTRYDEQVYTSEVNSPSIVHSLGDVQTNDSVVVLVFNKSLKSSISHKMYTYGRVEVCLTLISTFSNLDASCLHIQLQAASVQQRDCQSKKDLPEMQPQCPLVYCDRYVVSTTNTGVYERNSCSIPNLNFSPEPRPRNDTCKEALLRMTSAYSTLSQITTDNTSALDRRTAVSRPHKHEHCIVNKLLLTRKPDPFSQVYIDIISFLHILLTVLCSVKSIRVTIILNNSAGNNVLRSLLTGFFHEFPQCLKRRKKGLSWGLAEKHTSKHSWTLTFGLLCDFLLPSWTIDNMSDACNTYEPHVCQYLSCSLCKECMSLVDKWTASSARDDVPTTGFLSRLARQCYVVVRPLTRFLPDTTNNPALDLAHVGYRLATLSALPPSVPVSRVRLADAGFYYRGQGDEMICYKCQKRHSGWTNQDNPMEVHRRISPDCPHVLERDRVPSAPPENDPGIATPASHPVSQQRTPLGTAGTDNNPQGMVHGHEIHVEDGEATDSRPSVTASSEAPRVLPAATPGSHPPRPVPVSGAQETMPPGSSGSQARSTTSYPAVSASSYTRPGALNSCAGDDQGAAPRRFGLLGGAPSAGDSDPQGSGEGTRQMFPRAGLDLGGAVYPMYQDMASRRRSFPHWDDRRAPPLDQMILCGMFYAGYADCVRCFYCGVGLKHWEVTDDVWVEHVRWRPSCGYLRAVKGDEYIRRTLARLGREAAGEGEDGPPRLDRRDGDVRQGSNRAASTNPSRGQDGRTQPARPQANTPAGPPAAVTTTSSIASASRNQTPATPTSTTQAAAPAPLAAASRVASQTTTTTTSSVRSSAMTSAASSPGSCSDQSGARPEGAVRSDAASEESQSQRVARLQAENRELARRLRCKVCLTEPIDTILMPCGHLVVCETCARNVTQCPLCRERIRATAKVHMN